MPIQIELKDYAQWFGRRNSDEARGVLTYLAHKAQVAVEQIVMPGTIKRMLSSRSWVAVFDGLDEVPNDIKDDIAAEVCNFVDDVALQANADLLTICTSRPQGYSGQFSKMDGTTIDLIDLTVEQALLCAKPIVELNRSEDEAREYMNTLTAAIMSSSVRELMTTPLQSHIMAVVVRDGNRPPERRWALFNNFYQVIKRREANRNLPDVKIAKLLREDDQLLKKVHNRLGFALHSRAETHEGAQTSLDRSEFEKLVTNAVASMKDDPTNSYTKLLMEAAVERLVLVNTPDDGHHLRFDVRPLQEFFAAEFLYDRVNADELRRRVEIIAGDSHWREVMHFLLSALVENGRETELSVVIQVLEELNRSDDAPDLRLLRRRLGRGALLAARLLQEGVLEQDKRVREQFRTCLEPICAFTSSDALAPLTRVRAQSSLTWLYNLLIDTLKEANFSESIGAGLLLSMILPDYHPRLEEVIQVLRELPSTYISFVLEANDLLERDEFEDDLNLFDEQSRQLDVSREWIYSFAYEMLNSSKIVKNNAICVRAAKNLFSHEAKERLIQMMSFGKLFVDLLNIFFENEVSNPVASNDINLGLVRARVFDDDWTTGSYHFVSPIQFEESEVSGIFRLVYRVIMFAQVRNYTNFRAVLAWLEEYGYEHFGTLPVRLRAYFPLNSFEDHAEQFALLAQLDESGLNKLLADHYLANRKLPRPSFQLFVPDSHSEEGFKQTLDNIPSVAIDFWMGRFSNFLNEGSLELHDLPATIKPLLEAIKMQPETLMRWPGGWGLLLSKSGEHSEQVRALINSASNAPITEGAWGEEITPFELILPLEASLLPHLIYVITSAKNSRGLRATGYQGTIKDAEEIVKKFIPNSSSLKHVAQDNTLSARIKAAAALMYIIHPKGKKDFEPWFDVIVEAYAPEDKLWLLECLVNIIRDISTEQDAATLKILSKILDVTRSDYQSRQILENLLTSWREVSYAPVSKAGILSKWLFGAAN